MKRFYLLGMFSFLILFIAVLLYQNYRFQHKITSITEEIRQVREEKDANYRELSQVKRDLYLIQNDFADVEWPGTNTTFAPQLTGFQSSRIIKPKDHQVTTQKITYKEVSALYFSTNFHPALSSDEWVNITMYQYENMPYFTHMSLQDLDFHVAKISPLELNEKDFVSTSKQGYRIYKKTNEQFQSIALQFFMTPSDGKTRFISLTKHISGQKDLPEAQHELEDIIDSLR